MGAGDGIFRGEMSAESPSPVTAAVVQLRMKIFLRSPLRRKLLVRTMRLLDKINGQEVLETAADDALSVAMQNAGGGGGAVWNSLATTETQAELLAEAEVPRIHLALHAVADAAAGGRDGARGHRRSLDRGRRRGNHP